MLTDIELRQALQQTLDGLASQPQALDDIWSKKSHIWQELGWQKSQLSLWLNCQSAVVREASSGLFSLRTEGRSTADNSSQNLGDILLDLVVELKRPLPVKLALSKLPSHIVATEGMLKSAVQEHPKLTMMGPLIKLA
ncbi:hypothetical protein [Vibrio parahaemolyticus]|uniref:hypothetical protein n=1 Tax=Vibrio parahaemolyticus TaxID=670 RepID=UPI00111EBC4C|nr:hypothetical protein [Vibrio parahaemolyticus]TOH87540.1 hypothetical protein CGI71_20165 [Vibrio parahaemolyticus]TOL02734.1 hypothetical protein CGI09_16730 [Vibrio parahaemolyticus]TOP86904.1 hypothetical protein CGH08_10400 [Vibrio parahaemolyticus]TOQ27870.1 hypothetical protein CGG99_16600 [Vibrio parahaemolyticus]HAV1368366.1 hypothetical protein [Vibrio parahaemolyticus]